MNISAMITSAKAAIKANPGTYLIKGVGAAALGLMAYDSHVAGRIEADSYQKKKNAGASLNAYENTTRLAKPSAIQASLKKTLFNFEQDNNFRGFINSGIGYLKGFGSMLVSNIIPLGLGVATAVTKGLPQKICAGALGAYGLVTFMQDICGVGNKNYLKK